MFDWKTKTDKQKVKFVQAQDGRLKKRRQLYADLWGLIVQIFRPRRYDILGGQPKGKQFGTKIYDQHPSNALAKFVGGKLGYMISRRIPWIQFVSTDRKFMELDHVKQYCQEAAEQVLYAANRSNFYAAALPHALDAHSVGTSVSIPTLDEVRDKVIFDVVHPRDSYIAVDRFGFPIIYHRDLELTNLTALETFGQDKLPNTWFDHDKKGERTDLKNPFDENKYIWAVYPNNDRDRSSPLTSEMPYKVFCILKAGRGGSQSALVMESGRPRFPICWRSQRESGADYGTSIAADCLTASLVANTLGEKGLMVAHKAAESTKIGSKTLRRSYHPDPGGITWVDDINREGIKVIEERLNWPVTDAQMDRIHDQIDDKFFIRFFEMLSAGDMKARTAYEVSQMMGEKAVLMTTIVDTYEQESIEPHVEELMYAEAAAGRMPDPPQEMLDAGGSVDIEYLGPLAQLQRSLLRSRGIVDSLAILQQIQTMSEEGLWKINWLELTEEATLAQGLPQKLIRSDDEIRELQRAAAERDQMMMQGEMADKAAKLLPALNKRAEPGSMGDEMVKAGGAGGA